MSGIEKTTPAVEASASSWSTGFVPGYPTKNSTGTAITSNVRKKYGGNLASLTANTEILSAADRKSPSQSRAKVPFKASGFTLICLNLFLKNSVEKGSEKLEEKKCLMDLALDKLYAKLLLNLFLVLILMSLLRPVDLR